MSDRLKVKAGDIIYSRSSKSLSLIIDNETRLLFDGGQYGVGARYSTSKLRTPGNITLNKSVKVGNMDQFINRLLEELK